MHRLRSISKRVLAAFVFFTRLPFWRLADVGKEDYARVVPLWPLAGWLTGGIMAAVAGGALYVGLSAGVAVVLALLCRTLVTGALHEDGFADFCDGFGGGTTRERTLAIMKDSHIGTYGVLGLVLYVLLFFNALTTLLQHGVSPLVMVPVDALSKWLSSTVLYFLPYARQESEAKNRLVYAETPWGERVISLALGVAPLALLYALPIVGVPTPATMGLSLLPPMLGCALLVRTMRRRIGGYTGDCCGATFIITEALFYLSLALFA